MLRLHLLSLRGVVVMSTRSRCLFSLALAVPLFTNAVMAQTDQPPTAAATVPVAASEAPVLTKCSSTAKRHDHGAERNVSAAKPVPCLPDSAASGTKTAPTSVHDHGKFHKNQ